MEYTINKEGHKIACNLDTDESYDVFVGNGGEFLGTVGTREEAEDLMNKSDYPNEVIWIWDNRTNN